MSKSLTQSEYARAGFKCVPLQGMDLHGLKGTMMTYDDCLDTVEPVNDNNVVKQGNDYVYKWTADGIANYAISTGDVSSETWEKDGYVCRPGAKEPVYDSTMNFDDCVASTKSIPDEESFYCLYIEKGSMGGGPLDTIIEWNIPGFPFGEDKGFATDEKCRTCVSEKIEKVEAGSRVSGPCLPEGKYDEETIQRIRTRDQSAGECEAPSPHNADASAAFCQDNGIYQMVKSCFDDGKCSTCGYFKKDSLGPFKCQVLASNDAFPTTHDEAVTYYKENYAPELLCAPLKENSPFQCTGSEPKSAAEILSLSYANTQLAFSAFGSIFVFILYKCKKAKDPDFLQEDELLAKLEKLEADNAAMKADNAAIKGDNAAMKKAIERLEAGKA